MTDARAEFLRPDEFEIGKMLPAGTEIYGVLYEDSSVVGWRSDREKVVAQIGVLRRFGLSPVALIRLRMKFDDLIEDSE